MLRTRIAASVLACAFAVPAAAQNRQDLQTIADLRMLQEQVAKLQLTSNQLAEQLKTINKRIDDQDLSRQKQVADLQVIVNTLATTVNTVREKLDDNTVRVSQLMQELPGMRSGLSMLAEQLNTLVGLLQPPVNPVNPDAPATPGAGSLGTVRLPDSPTRIFDSAKSDYISNRLDNAIEGFTEFVQKFPDAPNAGEAQFWIGQSYYQKGGHCKEALVAYDKLISTYKTAAEVPDAYYQKGLCYLELGQRAEATRTFQLIVKQYPNSTQALLAQQKLAAPGTSR